MRCCGSWQTAMLRLSKLAVVDEIENGLAYFRIRSSPSCRALYADLEAALARRFELGAEPRLPPFLPVGSWIGGDRDGNPFVTAEMLELARSRSRRGCVLDALPGEVHALGASSRSRRALVRPPAAIARARAMRPATLAAPRATSPTAAR